jgi:hypothetical protein
MNTIKRLISVGNPFDPNAEVKLNDEMENYVKQGREYNRQGNDLQQQAIELTSRIHEATQNLHQSEQQLQRTKDHLHEMLEQQNSLNHKYSLLFTSYENAVKCVTVGDIEELGRMKLRGLESHTKIAFFSFGLFFDDVSFACYESMIQFDEHGMILETDYYHDHNNDHNHVNHNTDTNEESKLLDEVFQLIEAPSRWWSHVMKVVRDSNLVKRNLSAFTLNRFREKATTMSHDKRRYQLQNRWAEALYDHLKTALTSHHLPHDYNHSTVNQFHEMIEHSVKICDDVTTSKMMESKEKAMKFHSEFYLRNTVVTSSLYDYEEDEKILNPPTWKKKKKSNKTFVENKDQQSLRESKALEQGFITIQSLTIPLICHIILGHTILL